MPAHDARARAKKPEEDDAETFREWLAEIDAEIRKLQRPRKADRPRCGARTRTGGACEAPAVRGGSRCRMHGGRASGSGDRDLRALQFQRERVAWAVEMADAMSAAR